MVVATGQRRVLPVHLPHVAVTVAGVACPSPSCSGDRQLLPSRRPAASWLTSLVDAILRGDVGSRRNSCYFSRHFSFLQSGNAASAIVFVVVAGFPSFWINAFECVDRGIRLLHLLRSNNSQTFTEMYLF